MQQSISIQNGMAGEKTGSLVYQKPEIKVVSFSVEKGFSTSGESSHPQNFFAPDGQNQTESWHQQEGSDNITNYF